MYRRFIPCTSPAKVCAISASFCRKRVFIVPLTCRSKLCIACSDFLQKSERAHAAAPPFRKKVTLGSPARPKTPSQRFSVATNFLRVQIHVDILSRHLFCYLLTTKKHHPSGWRLLLVSVFWEVGSSPSKCKMPVAYCSLPARRQRPPYSHL